MIRKIIGSLIALLAGCAASPQMDSPLVDKVEMQLARADKFDSHHAYIYLARQQAIATAKKLSTSKAKENLPLFGMTLAIKDNIEIAGMPNSVGHKLLENYQPATDATVIQRVKDAGAIIMGKTNLHELTYGITSNNSAFGAVANAHNIDRFAGGSSGGTAVAIALGLADAGLGTDTGGSARIPAALNGIVGFRPTTGRYPNAGMNMISTTRDTVGPMAKDVATVARLDAVLADEKLAHEEKSVPGKLRIGVPKSYFYDNLSADVTKGMERVFKALADSGVELVVADVNNIGELNDQVGFPIVLFETRQLLPSLIKRANPGLSLDDFIEGISSPDVKGIVSSLVTTPIPEDVYRKAIDSSRPKLQSAYATYFHTHQLDALIVPATPLAAQNISGSDETIMLNGNAAPTFPTFIRNTDPSSNAGIPSLVIPMGTNFEGLPIALQLDGPVDSDRKLLAIGKHVEALIK